jgi:hypothetical protein
MKGDYMAVKAPPNVKRTDDRKAEAFITAGAGKPASAEVSEPKGRIIVNMRLDKNMVARIDHYAEKHGLTRTAAVHVLINMSLPPPE